MEKLDRREDKAFCERKRSIGSSKIKASFHPLFIDARGNKNRKVENIQGTVRRICLFHGERFRWKNRCRRCRHLITFQVRLN